MIPDHFVNLPALSIRQPWAAFILKNGKDIENRCWRTHFRGRFLIHAAKGCTESEYRLAVAFAMDKARVKFADIPPWMSLHRGGIVGVAKIGNCVTGSDSPWFVGEYGFVLEEVQPLDFTPCVGSLGFFRPQLKLPQCVSRQPSQESPQTSLDL